MVVFGTTLLGCAAGMVGSFALLRRRALMGDALSHATLPGIAAAFIFATTLGVDGKSLWFLLTGATISGLLGVGSILAIRNLTRLKEDAAMGIVLSVFFGAGVALAQHHPAIVGRKCGGPGRLHLRQDRLDGLLRCNVDRHGGPAQYRNVHFVVQGNDAGLF